MKKGMSKQDKALLESLEDRYGTENIANAIMLLAQKEDTKEQIVSPQEAILDYIMYLEGLRIRLREIHWESERNSRHLLTDSMIESIEKFEDDIAEDLMGIINFRIKVGSIAPKITRMVELGDVLNEFSTVTLQLCASIENDEIYTGIVNELDDMMHQIGKWKYLATMK